MPSLATRSTAIILLQKLLTKYPGGDNKWTSVAQTKWFQAVLLFDVHCVRNPDPWHVSSIPRVCAVLARLCHKFDASRMNPCTDAMLAKHVAGVMNELLSEAGKTPSNVSIKVDDLKNTELAVLTSLQWR